MENKAVLTVAAAVSLAFVQLANAADAPNLAAQQQKAPGTVAAPSPSSLSYLQASTPAKPAEPQKPASAAASAGSASAKAAAKDKDSATPAAKPAAPKPAVRRVPKAATKAPAAAPQIPGTFDLTFSGDIWKALQLLTTKQPKLTISALGSPFALPVHLDLKGVDLIEALRAIGDQTGDAADLVYNNQTHELRVVYKTPATTAPATMAAAVPAPLMGTLTSAPAQAAKPGPAVSPIDESRNWQKGGAARPIMGQDGLLQFPFGQVQPTLTCQPLRACDIQLQAGEIVNNVILGDTVRWIAAPAVTGSGAQATPHVVVKPTEVDLQTNLIITTNRRSYMLTLKSDNGQYISRVGFYYPQDIVQDWNGQAEAERRKVDEEAARKVSDLPIASIDQINLDAYRVKGDRSLPWYPVRVFDEGTHVWIQMPPSIKASEAPALVLIGNSGDSELVNYRVKEANQGGAKVTYYIVDKLFAKAALIVGVGGDQQKVEIIRNNTKGGSSWGVFDN